MCCFSAEKDVFINLKESGSFEIKDSIDVSFKNFKLTINFDWTSDSFLKAFGSAGILIEVRPLYSD